MKMIVSLQNKNASNVSIKGNLPVGFLETLREAHIIFFISEWKCRVVASGAF